MRQISRMRASLTTIAVVTIALMGFGFPFPWNCNDGSPASDPITPASDSGLPLCPEGKTDSDGTPCRPSSETDGGIAPCDSTTSSDLGTEASPDANVSPSDQGGTPLVCQTPPAPLVEGAECNTDNYSCVLWQDQATCLWFCGAPPDGLSSLSLDGVSQDIVLATCFPPPPPEPCPPPSIPNGTRCDLGCTIYWEDSGGKCMSDCSGKFGGLLTVEQIVAACAIGDPA